MEQVRAAIEEIGLYEIICLYGGVSPYLEAEHGMGPARAHRVEEYLYG